MGNQMSVPQRAEDPENDSDTDTYKVASRRHCAQNGMPVTVSTHTVQLYDEVDLGISVKEDKAATSSPGTMEGSAVAGANEKNAGRGANPEAPAARSRFFVTLSRPVPGCAGDQAEASPSAPGRRGVGPHAAVGNKGPSDSTTAAWERHPDKTPGRTPTGHQGSAPLPPASGGAAPSKPRDSRFFDKFFKLDRGQEKVPGDSQQEAESVAHRDQAQDTPDSPRQSDDAPAERDIVEGREQWQEVTSVCCSVPGNPEEPEIAREDPQTTDNSIMSFFKTLVSPNKAETKKDLEDTGAEKSPTTSAELKSDKANFVPQEPQGAARNPTATEAAKEGAKQKGGPPSLPLSKLFWKKSVKEDPGPTGAEEDVVRESPVEVIKSEEGDSALQTVDLRDEGGASPEPTEAKLKREELKPLRSPLMALFRQMSVKGDGGTTHSEEVNGKASSYQTPDIPEKAVVPPEPEPAGGSQKGKEGTSKDRKATAEANKPKSNKQDAKEPAPCACTCAKPAIPEAQALQNGHRPPKRPEKRRQSLGGFFKGLGPKRMSDAQVQTDPVSIGPVGKSK